MSERNGGHFEEFGLFVIVAAIVGGGILYVLYLFWPYFVFYVLPLAIGSLVIGGLLRIVTLPSDTGSGLMNYKSLAITYPVLIFLVAVIFFAGSEKAFQVDKQKHITATYLDWPGLNKTFNEWRSSTYEGSPFKSLKEAARESVVYDRQELGWIVLWCLFLGGPGFFWYLSIGDSEKDQAVIASIVKQETKSERERVQEKNDKLNEIIENRLQSLKEKMAVVERERARLESENRLLQAKVEFSPDIPRPPESVKTGGILDKDIL